MGSMWLEKGWESFGNFLGNLSPLQTFLIIFGVIGFLILWMVILHLKELKEKAK